MAELTATDGSLFKILEREGDWELFLEYSRTNLNGKPINYIVQNKTIARTKPGERVTWTFKTLTAARHTFDKLKYT